MPFKKGQSGNPAGRKKGAANILTAELKDMIEGALQDVGGRSYLARQAEDNPSAFMGLLGKILPKDINANVNGELNIRAWLMSLGEPDT